MQRSISGSQGKVMTEQNIEQGNAGLQQQRLSLGQSVIGAA
jgi:hypothetical protein